MPNPALTGWQGDVLSTLTGIQNLLPEPRATCDDCVMCAGPSRSGTEVVFRPDVKCCSFIPSIPNFLVGQALSGAGAASARQRIAARAGVTPLGLGVALEQVQPIVDAQPEFGRSDAVRCPHYQVQTRTCGVWESRNSVCSTWFCQHDRGAVSQRFWQSVRDLLMAAEERLAFACLTESGLPEGQVHTVLAHRAGIREAIRVATHPPDGPVPAQHNAFDEGPDWYDQLWGDWAGREQEWFIHCATMIGRLTPDELMGWMDGVRHLADTAQTAWQDLQVHQIPPGKLVFAPGEGSVPAGDVLRLVGYSPFDPVAVPAGLLIPLRLLDQEPSARELIDADVLGRLLDYGVVIPVPAEQLADH